MAAYWGLFDVLSVKSGDIPVCGTACPNNRIRKMKVEDPQANSAIFPPA
jgi:hypothetical protein